MTPRITLWTQAIWSVAFDDVVGVEWLARETGHTSAASLWRWAEAHQAIALVESAIVQTLVAWRRAGQGPSGRWWINLHPAGIVRSVLSDPHRWQQWQQTLEPVGWELLEGPGWDPATVRRLVELGGRVALDDWGNAVETIERLVQWPVTWVKLDAGLTRTLPGPAMARWIRVLQTFLGDDHRHLIAEGVETAEQWAAVQQLGIPLAQGFWLDHPRVWATLPTEALVWA